MILKPERILFFESFLFNTLLKKPGKTTDISFMNDDNLKVSLGELKGPLEDIKNRGNLPGLRQIFNALSSQEIQIIYSDKVTSGIVYIPIMDKNKNKIIAVRVNVSRFAKKKPIVNTLTGDITDGVDMNYEMLYTLLFGALVMLNAQKAYINPNLTKYLKTIYIDIMSNILNRTFGPPIYVDKFRFTIDYFFNNGEIDAKSLAQATSFDLGKANIMIANHPEYFEKKGNVTIEDMLKVMIDEFPNMKDISVNAFLQSAVTYLGESAFYMVDNQAYFLAVCAVRCRKEGRNIFGGMELKKIDADKAQIANLIIQTL